MAGSIYFKTGGDVEGSVWPLVALGIGEDCAWMLPCPQAGLFTQRAGLWKSPQLGRRIKHGDRRPQRWGGGRGDGLSSPENVAGGRSRVKPSPALRSQHTWGRVWLVCFLCCSNCASGDSVLVLQGSFGSAGLPSVPGPPGLPGMKGDRVSSQAVQKFPCLEGWFLLCWETRLALGPVENFSRNYHRDLSRKIS